MTTDRMNALGAAFLDLEDADPNVSLAIASVAVMGGPTPSREELLAGLGPRMATVRRYRQTVRRLPFDLARPRWVDDPTFDLDYHLRWIALPAPGGDEELERQVALIMSERLDRARPLWECWVIEGLSGGRWALLTKLHHCMVDGISGTQLYAAILDDRSQPAADDTSPTAALGLAEQFVAITGELAATPFAALRLLGNALRAPAKALRRVGTAVRGLGSLAGAVVPADATSLSGPLGHQRRYQVVRGDLPRIAEMAHAHGATVNDVVLTAISAGFRELLLARGEHPSAHAVRSLVPVSVRSRERADALDNQVSLMLPRLPVEIADPHAALAEVHTRLARHKAHHEAQAGEAMTSLADREPFAPLSWAIQVIAHFPQRNVITVTTNVPGPRTQLRVLGRPLLEILPYVPIAVRLRIGVAIMSYTDQIVIAITADHASVPDLDTMAKGIEHTLTALTSGG